MKEAHCQPVCRSSVLLQCIQAQTAATVLANHHQAAAISAGSGGQAWAVPHNTRCL